jgi:hypothetical protein
VRPGIYAVRPGGRRAARLVDLGEGAAVYWSPNGRWLALRGNDSTYVVSSGGRFLRRVGGAASSPAWSPSSTYVAWADPSLGGLAVTKPRSVATTLAVSTPGSSVSPGRAGADWSSLASRSADDRPIRGRSPTPRWVRFAGVPRSRILLTAAVATTTCAVAAVSAGAAPAKVFLVVTPHVVTRGNLVRLHGSAGSCHVGNTVFLISKAFPATHEFAGVPAVLTKVMSGGAFNVTVRIPKHKHSGLYHITGRCGGGNLGFYGEVRVLAHV